MHIKRIFPLAVAATTSAQSLTDVLAANNASLSTLTSLLQGQPALVQQLSQATNITILAPHNSAFTTFLNSLNGQTPAADVVTALLSYHVLQGNFPAASIDDNPAEADFVPSLLSNTSYTNVTGGQRVKALRTGNSVVFTSGLGQTSSVTTADVKFNGGTIHVIDKVLTIPPSIATTATTLNLTSLAGALTTAGLVDAVDSLKDVTVFAPTNAAFQAIGGTVAGLSTQQLASILEYHVVNGTVGYSTVLEEAIDGPGKDKRDLKIKAAAASNTLTLTTLNGATVTVSEENGAIFVNSAQVVTPDVLVANGVVHVINAVLNPSNPSATPAPSGSSTVPAFSGASSATNVPFTSGVAATPTTAGSGGMGTTGAGASATATGGPAQVSAGAAAPGMKAGVVEMGMLFGLGVWANL